MYIVSFLTMFINFIIDVFTFFLLLANIENRGELRKEGNDPHLSKCLNLLLLDELLNILSVNYMYIIH